MSKVIRVADDVFARLQRLAEPFVDTPSDVIQRLLDENDTRNEGTPMDSSVPRAHEILESSNGPQLYLVPASSRNVKETLERTVSLDRAAPFLEDQQVEDLKTAIGGKISFRCWAMTENSRSYWEDMIPGDLVLITRKGTGRFNFIARVAATIESQLLGEELWPVVPREPWSLIYILKDVEEISIDKARLVTSLGYNANYVVPGTIRVDPARLRGVVQKYGSIEQLIDDLRMGEGSQAA